MIRISSEGGARPGDVAVAGRLEACHVAEVEKRLQDEENDLALDLSELQSVDGGGACWLRGFVARGGRIIGASPYITYLLEHPRRSGEGLR